MNGIATIRKTRFVAQGRTLMMVRNSRQWFRYVLALTAAGLVLAVGAVSAAAGAKTSASKATTAVRGALQRLPRYGVFDFLAFRLDRGAVTLEGYAYGP